MASTLSGGFKVNAREALDIRMILSKAQMRSELYNPADATTLIALPTNYFCLCTDDHKIYVYDRTIPEDQKDPETGKFRLLDTAGIPYYIKDAVVDGNQLIMRDQNDYDIIYETKTINGESLVGEGDIAVTSKAPYIDKSTELSVSLNDLIEVGVYKINHASDNPANTSSAGTLVVNELQDDKVEQFWYSNTNYAHRILGVTPTPPTPPVPTDGFYVNSEKVTPDASGNIILAAGGIYELLGTLDGQVIISNSNNTLNYTRIILNGVTISTTTHSAILSENTANPEIESRMELEIREGSANTITVNTTTLDDSYGAIHVEADMFISGTGTLNITNNLGHGIKGTDIQISGKPNMVINVSHDAIHGKSLMITGGYYDIVNCNDAFSAGSNKNDGLLFVSGGEYYIRHCKENAFQAKGNGVIKIFYDTIITLCAGSTTVPFDDGGTSYSSTVILESVTIHNEAQATLPAIKTFTEFYGNAPVLTQNGAPVTPVNNVFTLSTNSGVTYSASGNFTGYRIVVPGIKTKIILNNVYYNYTTADESVFLEYTPNSKNVKLCLSDNTINYFKKADGILFKSNWHFVVNGNAGGTGHFYASCTNGCVIYAPNGDTRLIEDGSRYVVNSKYGIHTNCLTLGQVIDDPINESGSDHELNTKQNTFVYIDNNTEYDVGLVYSDALAREGHVGATANMYGSALIGNILDLDQGIHSPYVISEIQVVNPEDGSSFSRHAVVYTNANNLTNENIIFRNANQVIARAVTATTSTTWIVYCGITQQELDARYTLRTEYNALVQALEALELRVRALEQGSGASFNGNDLTILNANISSTGDVDLGNKAVLDANGNVILI